MTASDLTGNLDIARLADDYEAATREYLALANSVAESDLDTGHPQGWTARQVIHHVADSEAQSYARLRRLVAEPAGSAIQGYDEAAWAREPLLGYTELPVDISIAVTAAVRAASAVILGRLAPQDFERFGEHTESGRYTVAEWVANYTAHPREHGDQLRRALRGEL